MKRILVTGAAGFVGRHALAALSASFTPGDRVVGIGRGAPGDVPPGASFAQVDLLDARKLTSFISEYKPTDVLHLAAMASVQQSISKPTETWRTNIVGLLNLAEAMATAGSSSKMFFVSSSEVYGRAFLDNHLLAEDATPEPLGAYASSKWFGEVILRDVFMKANIRLVIVRPFNHVGRGQDERFVVPSFAGQIARIEAGLVPPVLEVGNLDAQRDFLSVYDVVRAYVGLIAHTGVIPDGTVFNIASGVSRSISSVLEDLRRHARVPFTLRIALDRTRPSEIPVAAGDASRLTATIGWRPEADWHAVLADVLAEARAIITATQALSGP